MNAPSMIGTGVGFALVGIIFGLLSIRKPDLPMFKARPKEQFYRLQGVLAAFVGFGLMLILMALMPQ